MNDPLAPFRWLEGGPGNPDGRLDDIFCVSFFRELTPADVLRRFASTPSPGREATFADLETTVHEFVDRTGGGDGGGHVGVVQAGRWCLAVELFGWEAAMTPRLAQLSVGTEVVVVARHDYAEDSFCYAVDGDVIVDFPPRWATPGANITGSDLGRLDGLMREVGLLRDDNDGDETYPDDAIARAFLLAAKITGVAFTPDLLDGPILAGPIEP